MIVQRRAAAAAAETTLAIVIFPKQQKKFHQKNKRMTDTKLFSFLRREPFLSLLLAVGRKVYVGGVVSPSVSTHKL